MGSPYLISSDIGNSAFQLGGQPIFHTSNGAPLGAVSASFADKANTAYSSSYAYSASIAARTGSPQ